MHLSLSFLGCLEVRLNAEPITAFGGDKVRALLAYLTIESARPHRRAELSAMFWPDLPESKAAHNLSQSLLRLRRALHELESPPHLPFLLVTTQDVQFNEASDWTLDVSRFRVLLQMAHQHKHVEAARCEVCFQWLLEAAELYRGDLLRGLFLADSVKFEEWQLINQEELRRQALETLKWLTVYYEQRGNMERAQEYARRQIALEPFSEEAQFQLIRFHTKSGQTSLALRQYEIYERTLEDELGIKPSAEMTTFCEQIRSGESAGTDPSQPRAGEGSWLSNQGERRQVTALVCGRFAQGDSDESQEQLTDCERYCTPVFSRFGGKRALRQGDDCLVYFGYPQAYEDAARRAVHSGLAIIAAVDGNEPMHIGIHTGVMTVGEKRGRRWQDRALIGKAPDVARECQRLAEPGGVMISESTRRLVNEYFETKSIGPQKIGKTMRELEVHRVQGEDSAQSRLEWLARTQRLTAFTGRTEEKEQLQAWYESMLKGKGKVVVIKGEPGIGKSRLVWEFEKNNPLTTDTYPDISERSKPVLWLSSHCLSQNQNSSLYPMIGLFEGALGIQGTDSPDLRLEKLKATLASYKMNRPSAVWLLSILLGLPTDEPAPETITRAQRDQMRELFVVLLKKCAAEQPVVLVVEDMHWSDLSTIDWMGQSIDSIGSIRCLVLLTARPSFNPAWLSRRIQSSNLHNISLQPLSVEQVQEMVFDLAGGNTIAEETRQHIVAHTDGNPLFVEELTKTILERSDFKTGWDVNVDVPPTLIDSLTARLDHLGSAKEVAQWAAVFGREFSYPILKACVPFDEQQLEGGLARLIVAELVAPINAESQDRVMRNPTIPAGYAFRHVLVQEAAYLSMLKKTREACHRQIAETLKTRFPNIAETQPEVLAQHYANAGLIAEAVDYWICAGKHATAQGATLEAKFFFDRALEGSKSVDQEQYWRALLGREQVLSARGEREAQQADLASLLELAETLDDDIKRAQVHIRQTSYAATLGDYRTALTLTEAAKEAARRAGDRTLECKALANQAQALLFSGNLEAARGVVEETISRIGKVKDYSVRALGLTAAAQYYLDSGDLARSLKYQSESAKASKLAQNLSLEATVNANLGMVYAMLGLYSQARTAVEIGLARAELLGDRWLHASALRHLGYIYWQSRERDLARQTIERSLAELDAINDTYGKAACLSYLGYILEDAKEWTLAATYLADARLIFENIGSNPDKFEAQAAEARVILSLGRQEEARDLIKDVYNYLQENGPDGFSSPPLIYICIADVLGAVEIPNISLQEVIESGYRELMHRSEKISNTNWRRSFLENVPENKDIVKRWNNLSESKRDH